MGSGRDQNFEEGPVRMNTSPTSTTASTRDQKESNVIARLLRETGWNKEPLNFTRSPVKVHSEEAFWEHLYYGLHEDSAVVWPQGIECMDMLGDIPAALQGVDKHTSLVEFMRMMPKEQKEKLDGRIYAFDKKKEKKPVSKSTTGHYLSNLLEKEQALGNLNQGFDLKDQEREESSSPSSPGSKKQRSIRARCTDHQRENSVNGRRELLSEAGL